MRSAVLAAGCAAVAASRSPFAVLAAGCAAVAASRSPFAVPPATAGFVPVLADGSTLWAYLSSLRRSAFPMIAANQPERTLFVDAAVDTARCGITPPLKGLGYEEGTCWPGAFAWLWASEPFDRTDYLLRLHSTNTRASTRSVFDANPQHALVLASGAPWEALLARSEVRLRWSVRARGFRIETDMWADSVPQWSTASSPQVRRVGTLPLRRRRVLQRDADGPLGSASGGGGASDGQGATAGVPAAAGPHAVRQLYDGWNASNPRLLDGGHKEFDLFGAQFDLTDGMIRSSTESRAVSAAWAGTAGALSLFG